MSKPRKFIKMTNISGIFLIFALGLIIQPAIGQFAPGEAKGYYMLDALGGLHSVGSIPAPLVFDDFPYPDPGNVADSYIGLALTPDNQGLWALTRGGMVYSRGQVGFSLPEPLFNWDIARDIESGPDNAGFYLLDGYGAVHSLGSAPLFSVTDRPYFGWDIARDVEIVGDGFILLDGYGGVHAVSDAAKARLPRYPGTENIIPSAYFGWDIAKDIELVPPALGPNGYWTYDGYGGIHPTGEFAPVFPNMYFGWDIAQDIELLFFPDTGFTYWELDGFGGMHPSADQTDVANIRQFVRFSSLHYLGWDVAVDFEVISQSGVPVLPTMTPTYTITPTPAETTFVPTLTPTIAFTLIPTLTPTITSTSTPTFTPEETEFTPELIRKLSQLVYY